MSIFIYQNLSQEQQIAFNQFILDNLLDKTEFLEILTNIFNRNLLKMSLEERKTYLKTSVDFFSMIAFKCFTN